MARKGAVVASRGWCAELAEDVSRRVDLKVGAPHEPMLRVALDVVALLQGGLHRDPVPRHDARTEPADHLGGGEEGARGRGAAPEPRGALHCL